MKTITPLEAAELLKKDSDTVLVDVRTPAEVSETSVPGALLVPLDQITSRLHELEGYRAVLFMCRSGGRSAVASSIAESSGIPGVHNITGGIIAWASAGLPLVHGRSRGMISTKMLAAGGIILIGVVFALFIFTGNKRAGDSHVSAIAHVPAAQFAEDIGKPGTILLDVRTPEEYATGHIAGSRNINFYDPNFQEELNNLDKGVTYEVYCHSGSRSGKTLLLMNDLGFTHVEDLSGGILSWLSEGRPIDR